MSQQNQNDKANTYITIKLYKENIEKKIFWECHNQRSQPFPGHQEEE